MVNRRGSLGISKLCKFSEAHRKERCLKQNTIFVTFWSFYGKCGSNFKLCIFRNVCKFVKKLSRADLCGWFDPNMLDYSALFTRSINQKIPSGDACQVVGWFIARVEYKHHRSLVKLSHQQTSSVLNYNDEFHDLGGNVFSCSSCYHKQTRLLVSRWNYGVAFSSLAKK